MKIIQEKIKKPFIGKCQSCRHTKKIYYAYFFKGKQESEINRICKNCNRVTIFKKI